MNEPGSDFPDPKDILCRVGGPVDSCSACLRFFGEDLDPIAVTELLGASPTSSCRKGDVIRRNVTRRVERQGKWLLDVDHQAGITLETVINELLNRLTSNLEIWLILTNRFQADLFCGLNMEAWNRGLNLSPRTLSRIAERGLTLGLDIYFMGKE